MKKTLQTNIAVNEIRMTLDCVSLVSYGSFIAMLVWSVFVSIYQNVCLLFLKVV